MLVPLDLHTSACVCEFPSVAMAEGHNSNFSFLLLTRLQMIKFFSPFCQSEYCCKDSFNWLHGYNYLLNAECPRADSNCNKAHGSTATSTLEFVFLSALIP